MSCLFVSEVPELSIGNGVVTITYRSGNDSFCRTMPLPAWRAWLARANNATREHDGNMASIYRLRSVDDDHAASSS